MNSHRSLVLLLLILLFALTLRLVGAGDESLWEDEAASVAYARRPAADLVAKPEDPGNPPGYYLMLKPWVAVFGEDETLLRVQSILLGLATVLATFFLGRKVTGRDSVGLAAALLLAASACHVHFSQEVRSYAAVTLLAVLTTIALLDALATNRRRAWALFALGGAAMAWLHYQALFVLFGQGAAATLWLARAKFPRRRIVPAALAVAAVILLSLPALWIHLRPSLIQSGVYDFWQPFAAPGDAWLALLRSTFGGGLAPDLPVAAALLSVFAALLPWLTMRLVSGRNADEHRLPFLTVYYAGAGLFFLVAFLKPVWQDKYLLAFQPLVLIALACGLVWLGERIRKAPWLPAVAAALLFLPANVYLMRHSIRPDYRAAVAHLEQVDPQGETPVLVFRFAWFSVRHYLGREVIHEGSVEPFCRKAHQLSGRGRVLVVLSESQSFRDVQRVEEWLEAEVPIRNRFTANRIRVLELGPIP